MTAPTAKAVGFLRLVSVKKEYWEQMRACLAGSEHIGEQDPLMILTNPHTSENDRFNKWLRTYVDAEISW